MSNVDHPEHYNKGLEAIDVIESWDLKFNAGNVIKYLLRSPHKGNEVEDLKKAKWYLDRHLQNITKV